jgi:hypothetical protein
MRTPIENRRKADKKSGGAGKDTELGRFRENPPSAGDVKNDTAGL